MLPRIDALRQSSFTNVTHFDNEFIQITGTNTDQKQLITFNFSRTADWERFGAWRRILLSKVCMGALNGGEAAATATLPGYPPGPAGDPA